MVYCLHDQFIIFGQENISFSLFRQGPQLEVSSDLFFLKFWRHPGKKPKTNQTNAKFLHSVNLGKFELIKLREEIAKIRENAALISSKSHLVEISVNGITFCNFTKCAIFFEVELLEKMALTRMAMPILTMPDIF